MLSGDDGLPGIIVRRKARVNDIKMCCQEVSTRYEKVSYLVFRGRLFLFLDVTGGTGRISRGVQCDRWFTSTRLSYTRRKYDC